LPSLQPHTEDAIPANLRAQWLDTTAFPPLVARTHLAPAAGDGTVITRRKDNK